MSAASAYLRRRISISASVSCGLSRRNCRSTSSTLARRWYRSATVSLTAIIFLLLLLLPGDGKPSNRNTDAAAETANCAGHLYLKKRVSVIRTHLGKQKASQP